MLMAFIIINNIAWNNNSIFKKVYHIILSRFDYSRSSKLYFIIGNILFVSSTFIWISIQPLSNHSIPFAAITYPSLFLPILLFSYKRG